MQCYEWQKFRSFESQILVQNSTAILLIPITTTLWQSTQNYDHFSNWTRVLNIMPGWKSKFQTFRALPTLLAFKWGISRCCASSGVGGVSGRTKAFWLLYYIDKHRSGLRPDRNKRVPFPPVLLKVLTRFSLNSKRKLSWLHFWALLRPQTWFPDGRQLLSHPTLRHNIQSFTLSCLLPVFGSFSAFYSCVTESEKNPTESCTKFIVSTWTVLETWKYKHLHSFISIDKAYEKHWDFWIRVKSFICMLAHVRRPFEGEVIACSKAMHFSEMWSIKIGRLSH